MPLPGLIPPFLGGPSAAEGGGEPGSTGWVLAGAGANNADAGDVAWTNPGNVTASDDARATANVASPDTTQYLHATSFGHALPAGATVTGVEVRVERHASAADRVQDHTVQLIKGGTRQGDNKADTGTSWPDADATVDYGGSTAMWSLALTKADVEAAGFGVALRGKSSVNAQHRVDAIWTNIHYTT